MASRLYSYRKYYKVYQTNLVFSWKTLRSITIKRNVTKIKITAIYHNIYRQPPLNIS